MTSEISYFVLNCRVELQKNQIVTQIFNTYMYLYTLLPRASDCIVIDHIIKSNQSILFCLSINREHFVVVSTN